MQTYEIFVTYPKVIVKNINGIYLYYETALNTNWCQTIVLFSWGMDTPIFYLARVRDRL